MTTHLCPVQRALELSLFLGAKHYGNRQQKSKRALILNREQYRYQRFISDIAGASSSSSAWHVDDLAGVAGGHRATGMDYRTQTIMCGLVLHELRSLLAEILLKQEVASREGLNVPH
jgi:hypothetical protein